MAGCVTRRRTWWMICVLTAVPAQVGQAQIFARVSHEQAAAANRSCGFRPCSPKLLTYGYYHEHWRKWPEEPAAGTLSELSPFAVPDRTTPPGPTTEVPDPRDETSSTVRKRTAVPIQPDDAENPMPGQSAPPMTTPGRAADDPLQPSLPEDPGAGGLESLDSLPADSMFSPTPAPTDLELPELPAEQDSLPGADPNPDCRRARRMICLTSALSWTRGIEAAGECRR